jgi:flavorubredoxin
MPETVSLPARRAESRPPAGKTRGATGAAAPAGTSGASGADAVAQMAVQELFNDGTRAWYFFGRDPTRQDHVIDTNEYLVVNAGKAMLLDPGGLEIFPSVVSAVSRQVELQDIEVLFSSHQDPDIVSSLSLWTGLVPDVKVYVSWVWSKFISHFGGGETLISIPDEGMRIPLGGSENLEAIPAHYLHSSGNFSLYDPTARILFSGDIGAALLPEDHTDVFVGDFEQHTQYMEGFHRRWMPSNRAKERWVERVGRLKLDLLCPQHGAIFTGENIGRFLRWFNNLEVGSAIE